MKISALTFSSNKKIALQKTKTNKTVKNNPQYKFSSLSNIPFGMPVMGLFTNAEKAMVDKAFVNIVNGLREQKYDVVENSLEIMSEDTALLKTLLTKRDKERNNKDILQLSSMFAYNNYSQEEYLPIQKKILSYVKIAGCSETVLTEPDIKGNDILKSAIEYENVPFQKMLLDFAVEENLLLDVLDNHKDYHANAVEMVAIHGYTEVEALIRQSVDSYVNKYPQDEKSQEILSLITNLFG